VLTDLNVSDGLERHAVLQVMASVEQGSDHPIARAIVAAAAEERLDLLPIEGGQTFAGLGLSAQVAGAEAVDAWGDRSPQSGRHYRRHVNRRSLRGSAADC
jgi:cation transport ATPase